MIRWKKDTWKRSKWIASQDPWLEIVRCRKTQVEWDGGKRNHKPKDLGVNEVGSQQFPSEKKYEGWALNENTVWEIDDRWGEEFCMSRTWRRNSRNPVPTGLDSCLSTVSLLQIFWINSPKVEMQTIRFFSSFFF